MEEDWGRRTAQPKGKLHKGVVLQHTRTQSTIPAKCELAGPPPAHTHAAPAQSGPKKGFSSTARRTEPFGQTTHSLQMPGPGSYTQGEREPASTPSTSKKGAGNGFASATKRFPTASPATMNGPAPGQYYDIKKDSSFDIASPKHVPVYSDFLPPHEPSPGPGNYDPHDPNYPSPNSKGSSSFISTAQRTEILPNYAQGTRKMGPGKYNPSDPSEKKVSVSAPFRSHTKRSISFSNSSTPGPGSYAVEEKIEKAEKDTKTKPGRLKTSSLARSSSAQPSRPSASVATPGPGEYLPLFSPSTPSAVHPSPSAPPRIRRQSVPISLGSSFASRTQRTQLVAPQVANALGPGEYHSDAPLVKQSFNSNRKENWV